MKTFELKIEDESTDMVFALSLVDDPAIQAWGTYFSKEEVRFAEVEGYENLFMAPILIPDREILRVDGEGNPYNVFLSKSTVKRLSQMYLENKFQDQVTLEHDAKVQGVTLIESWIKESTSKDKSLIYNLSAPVGSWIGTFRITNPELQEKFRSGEVSAISIEGLFSHELVEASKVEDKDVDDFTEEEADEFLKLLRNLIFGEEEVEFESYSDYPDSVKNNAKRGIELNENQNNKCATQTGKVRAQQLASGESISVDTIKRMHSYLSRAETYYDPNETTECGTISYLLWGGKAALGWSRNKLRELGLLEENDVAISSSYPGEKSEDMITPNPCQQGYVAIGTKIKNGKEVPNCVPEE